MKVGIAGGGPAGAYLAYLLRTRSNIDVELIEKKKPNELGVECAWALSKYELRKLFKRTLYLREIKPLILFESIYEEYACGNFSKRYLSDGLVTIDKTEMLKKLISLSGVDVRWETDIQNIDYRTYDILVDATGSKRVLLGDELDKTIVPCYQAVCENDPDKPYSKKFEDFYIEYKGLGYIWVFPIGDGMLRVGYASRTHNPKKVLEEFVEERMGKVHDWHGSTIRANSPENIRQKYSLIWDVTDLPSDSVKVVGCGESIGTVSPLTGEGITPSMKCAKILYNHLDFSRTDTDKQLRKYVRQVERRFRRFTVQEYISDAVNSGSLLKTLWSARKLRKADMRLFDLSDMPKTDYLKILWNTTREIKEERR